MKKNFTILSFLRVLKMEYPELIIRIIGIAQKYNPKALFLESMLARLNEKRPLLDKMEIDYRKEAKTKDVNKLRLRREGIMKSVLLNAKGLEHANIPSLEESVKVVLPFVEKYFRNFKADNIRIRTRRINLMAKAVDTEPGLSDALVNVGLMIHINELRSLQLEIETIETELVEVKSSRPRINSMEIKDEVTSALLDFFKAIDLAIIEHPELDYQPLVNEINQLLGTYKSHLKAKNTRRKNAASDEKSVEAA